MKVLAANHRMLAAFTTFDNRPRKEAW